MHQIPKKNKRALIISTLIVFFLFAAIPVLAQTSVSLGFPSSFAGLSNQELRTTIENIVRIVLGFIGIVFILLVLYGGFVWMTSGGDQKKITQAKKIIASAVIGLLITLSAYSIARFIIKSYEAATAPSSGSSGPTGFGWALGNGILESHYPGRYATGIPRNTNILITFKEDVDMTTMCSLYPGPGNDMDGDGSPDLVVNEASIQITRFNLSADGLDLGGVPDVLDFVKCESVDNQTFKLDPGGSTNNHLGDANSNVIYNVFLTNTIKTATNKVALPLGYIWQFTTSQYLDLTPPTILSVIPIHGATVARNSIVQINFSEPVDPTTASGIYDPAAPAGTSFEGIVLDDTAIPASPFLGGQYRSGNQYQTIEFISNLPCDGAVMNSCGEPIYCFPANTKIFGFVYSDATKAIRDLAGNALDGENNAVNPTRVPTGDGSEYGDFDWEFTTTNTIDLSPPEMESRDPIDTGLNANLYTPVKATFNEVISVTSVTTRGYLLDFSDPPTCQGVPPAPNLAGPSVGFWTSAVNLYGGGPSPIKTEVYLNHDAFDSLSAYCPVANSKIRDLQQNCFNPAICNPILPGSC